MLAIITDYGDVVRDGLLMTIWISVLGIILGGAVGLILSAGLASPNSIIAWPCRVYRSAVRGTPILVQLLMLFYMPTALGYQIDPFVAATLGLGLNSAAFQAEIFRACSLAIPKGQIEAADILGFKPLSIWWSIKLPQVIRLSLPPLINELGILVKNSSLVSIISVTELMRRGQQIVSASYQPLETYALLAIIYIVLNLALARSGSFLEGRLAASGKE